MSARKQVVSSANCEILTSSPLMDIPLIFELFLIEMARSSTARMNRKGAIGQPCLTPLERFTNSEVKPLLIIQEQTLVNEVEIYLLKSGSKLKESSTWWMKGHSIVSNAFSKFP